MSIKTAEFRSIVGLVAALNGSEMATSLGLSLEYDDAARSCSQLEPDLTFSAPFPQQSWWRLYFGFSVYVPPGQRFINDSAC